MLKIDLRKDVVNFLEKLPLKHKKQVVRKISGLRENPVPQDSKKLKGKLSSYRRADAGEYRIIYFVKADVLKVCLVGKRNDNDAEVYRKMKRKRL